MPPTICRKSARGIRPGIPRIAGRPHDVRANDFEQHRPANHVPGDFGRCRRPVVRPQPEPSVDLEQHRKRARDQQAIIEPIVEEPAVDERLYQPSVGRIHSATCQEQRVAEISKAPHSNARMISPNPNPSKTFNMNDLSINMICRLSSYAPESDASRVSFEKPFLATINRRYSTRQPQLDERRPQA